MHNLRKLTENYIPGVIGFEKIFMSSVIIPVIEIEGEQHIIFEVRSSKLKTQPGEVSFPGGRIEYGETPEDAAVREFCEELQCSENMVEIIAKLDYYINMSKGIIYSFAGIVDKDIDLNINNDEVDHVFTVPLQFFMDNEPFMCSNRIKTIPADDFPFREMYISENYYDRTQMQQVSFYKYKGHVIWGITANILKNFVDYIKEQI